MRTTRSSSIALAVAAITMAIAGPAAAAPEGTPTAKRKTASCAKSKNVALCKALKSCDKRYSKSKGKRSSKAEARELRAKRTQCRANARKPLPAPGRPPTGAPAPPQASPGGGDATAPVVDPPPPPPPPGLKIVSMSAPAVVDGPSPFSTTIVIRNDGPTAASQVELYTTNEGGASKAVFDSFNGQVTGGSCLAVDAVSYCSLPELAVGAEATATIPATSKCAGAFSLRADVSSGTADPVTADNTARRTIGTSSCG